MMSPVPRPARVLVVENDPHFLRVLLRILRPHYAVTETHTAELALDLILEGYQFDVVLCDMRLDGWSGRDLYTRLSRRRDPHTSRFVVLSGIDVSAVHPAFAAELGERLLEKPVVPAALLSTLERVRSRAAE